MDDRDETMKTTALTTTAITTTMMTLMTTTVAPDVTGREAG